ncbi:MAG: DNA-binding protein [Chitinophagaceae bacterium]|nr:MAG: DNA-binding protein [Chitinophagaceae bacterium]
MRELNIEQRLKKMEENIAVIKQMLEILLNKQISQPISEEGKGILNVKQVAQFLGLDANVIYAKCSKGDIPYFKIGKQYRFKKSEIIKWVEGQKGSPGFSVEDYVDRYMQEHVLKA